MCTCQLKAGHYVMGLLYTVGRSVTAVKLHEIQQSIYSYLKYFQQSMVKPPYLFDVYSPISQGSSKISATNSQSHDQCMKNWVKILTAAVANLPVYMRVTPACIVCNLLATACPYGEFKSIVIQIIRSRRLKSDFTGSIKINIS